MAVEAHEYVPCSDEDRCQACGSKYHCAKCNIGCSMMGHRAEDEAGSYYTCQEPERREAQLRAYRAIYEANEKTELARLKAKYPDA